jgi:hypothetical protein
VEKKADSNRQAAIQAEGHTVKWLESETEGQTDKQADKHAVSPSDRLSDKQTD